MGGEGQPAAALGEEREGGKAREGKKSFDFPPGKRKEAPPTRWKSTAFPEGRRSSAMSLYKKEYQRKRRACRDGEY